MNFVAVRNYHWEQDWSSYCKKIVHQGAWDFSRVWKFAFWSAF